MSQVLTFHSPTQLFFGPGAINKVADVALYKNIKIALVVSDPGVRAAGIPDQVSSQLVERGIQSVIFDAVETNPGLETINLGYNAYLNNKCNGIIAVGGGSSIDTAKAVGILASNPGKLLDYIGIDKVINPHPPLLVIPSTVGSGSEVSRFIVVSDHEEKKKLVIGSGLIPPHIAFLDPNSVLSLPPQLIASTGLDALTHAMESVLSNFASPFTDSYALEAIRLIQLNLHVAYQSKDKAAMANLLYASTMAGIAFSNARTGLVHGMSHPLSSYHNTPHGLANAILLPFVLEYNLPKCEVEMQRLAIAMGESPNPDAAISSVRRLSALIEIPPKLSDVGVTNEFITNMAKDAFESGNARLVNPRTPTLQEVIDLYNQAL